VRGHAGSGRAMLAGLLFCGFMGSLGGTAAADESDACLSAPLDGQKLQKAGKLLDAHDKFNACARKTCPTEIVQYCTRQLSAVEEALPTVVMAARDEDGHDLVDVRVSIDGKPPVPMSARAISMDPGPHKFVFERGSADAGKAVDQQVILREGEKHREVVVTFALKAKTMAVPAPTPIVTERPVPAAAWVSGAIGIAGFAVLATFGSIGVSDRSSEHCDTGCPQSQKSSVDSDFRVADIGIGVGAVGVALATVLFLSRPTVEVASPPVPGAPSAGASRHGTLLGLDVDVRGTPGGGVAVLGGRF